MISVGEWIAKRLPSRDGWCSADAAQAIYDHLIQSPGPINGLEIGVCGGRSFFPAVLACRDHPKRGKMAGIDAYDGDIAAEFHDDPAAAAWWRAKATHAKARRQVENEIAGLQLGEFAELIVGDSHDAAIAARFQGLTYLCVDGNHNGPAVARDLDLYLPLVAAGGLIRLDDTVANPGVVAQLPRVIACCDFVDAAADGQWEIWRRR